MRLTAYIQNKSKEEEKKEEKNDGGDDDDTADAVELHQSLTWDGEGGEGMEWDDDDDDDDDVVSYLG